MTFDAWWEAVTREAKRCWCGDLLGDQESHRDGFEDGYTPAEEVDEAIYSAQVSM